MMILLCFCQFQAAFAQNKKNVKSDESSLVASFEILENGDTINRLDHKNRKLGKWLIINKGGYGEEDFMELGFFQENLRTGVWKTYTMEGVIISQEFYKQGNKSGEARYYDEGQLYCVGNYLALRSKYDYDTIMVEDPLTSQFRPVVIKTDVGSVRHGFWTYYDPQTNEVRRVVEYQADEMIYEKEYTAKVDSTYIKQRMKAFSKGEVQTNAMMPDKNKRLSKFTDIPDDVQYVKPNIRRKGK
jgi:antitoxin component YwqK of YwqJK toxin-antitoxin module